MPDHYVWLIWSSLFLIPWGLLYLLFPLHRKAMLWVSAFTMPFGLTEPIFVPEYWAPPSLFACFLLLPLESDDHVTWRRPLAG